MAKARVQALRPAGHVDVRQDDFQAQDPEDTLDESADPLEESGRTVDTSDEEIDESVADEMARFEESFVGINKRYRLINRIGEGIFPLGSMCLASLLTFVIRHLLDSIQSRGPGIPQVREQLGRRRT